MASHLYQAWKDPEGESIHYWRADYGPRPPGISDSSELLWQFEAATSEEAMSVHFLRLGWAPYRPEGEPSKCPTCGSIYYPEGSAECWKCESGQ